MTLLMTALTTVALFSTWNSSSSRTNIPPNKAEPPNRNYQVLYEWRQVDYNFPSDKVRQDYIRSGDFVPLNCAPTGIKVYQDVVFVATPRFRAGVPATLNVIPYWRWKDEGQLSRKGLEGPLMTPFPTWGLNKEGDCRALQNVLAMELDPFNRLWIVDVGRVNILDASGPRNLCPAKLMIYDLELGRIDRVHQFPHGVAPRDANVIKDIQVACVTRDDCYAYISNVNTTSSLVVYDYWNDESWYATHPTMQAEMFQSAVAIDYVTAIVPFGITGLGLTPKFTNYSTLYFSKIAGNRIYCLPAAALHNANKLRLNPTLPEGVIQDLGVKPMGQADGTAMDNRGVWYFGSLPNSAAYSIDTTDKPDRQISRAIQEVQSNQEMQWPDTFSFDGLGNLLFTTTRFQRYANTLINANEINYRLIRFKTETVAYSA